MNTEVVLLVLVSVATSSFCYPIYEPRIQYQDPTYNLRELMLWQQQNPPRAEYEPAAYGYPDYGDYEIKPAYSELDILRHQLARSPPLTKRLLPYEPPEEAELVYEPEPATWYDSEIRVEKPGVEELTEALLELLAQQVREDSSEDDQEQEEDDDDGTDSVVQELKAAVKKSSTQGAKKMVFPSTTTTTTTTTNAPSTTTPTVPTRTTTVSTTTANHRIFLHGQKEVPLLRPAQQNHRVWPSHLRPDTKNNKRTSIRKNLNSHRFVSDRKFITPEEELTEELDSLKKMAA